MISFDEVSDPGCTELNFSHNLVKKYFSENQKIKLNFRMIPFLILYFYLKYYIKLKS
jgi:hypothetical protein